MSADRLVLAVTGASAPAAPKGFSLARGPIGACAVRHRNHVVGCLLADIIIETFGILSFSLQESRLPNFYRCTQCYVTQSHSFLPPWPRMRGGGRLPQVHSTCLLSDAGIGHTCRPRDLALIFISTLFSNNPGIWHFTELVFNGTLVDELEAQQNCPKFRVDIFQVNGNYLIFH